jgi:hypothetical protein
LCVEGKSRGGDSEPHAQENVDDAQLPELVHDLPHLRELLGGVERLLSVQATFFFEGFCGTAGVTVGVCLHKAPAVAKPFDLKFGEEFDLLKHEDMITALIFAGILGFIWLGTPCRSMTYARIPQLRSADEILGKKNLSEKQRQIVDVGASLVYFSAKMAFVCIAHGADFAIENHGRVGCGCYRCTLHCGRSQQ